MQRPFGHTLIGAIVSQRTQYAMDGVVSIAMQGHLRLQRLQRSMAVSFQLPTFSNSRQHR